VKIVLASRSAIRVKLLRDVGLVFDTDPADLDEDALVAGIDDPAERAALLAREKAKSVSGRHQGALVIGADQVGVLEDGTFLDKPRDSTDHTGMLMNMAGRAHTFYPSAAVVIDGVVRAEVSETVRVTFRPFPAETAAAYVDTGEGRGSCGGYESEHRGAQLIERIEGSTHAVLGLPLLPLLAALRGIAPGLLMR
jgi:septum formation protein